MRIGLDYDGTVTSDYMGFVAFVRMMRQRGHEVYVTTMRYVSECKNDLEFCVFAKNVDGVIATGREAKKEYCLKYGITIDVWIDDNPRAVEESANQIWGTPSPEGTVVIEDHATGIPKRVQMEPLCPSNLWGIAWIGDEKVLEEGPGV